MGNKSETWVINKIPEWWAFLTSPRKVSLAVGKCWWCIWTWLTDVVLSCSCYQGWISPFKCVSDIFLCSNLPLFWFAGVSWLCRAKLSPKSQPGKALLWTCCGLVALKYCDGFVMEQLQTRTRSRSSSKGTNCWPCIAPALVPNCPEGDPIELFPLHSFLLHWVSKGRVEQRTESLHELQA